MSDLLLHVTGARPNFPKAAPVLAALDDRGFAQRLVHTGQHYDDNMSAVFFRELHLPSPDVNLGVGSGSHAEQTAAIMVALEKEMLAAQPSLVIVYGDVNSTLAAALVTSKLGIPIAHVEAGLRSGDWTMPEEVNRVVTDRLSDRLYATSADAVAHLGSEGVPVDRIRLVGNPMIDTLLKHRDAFDGSRVRAALGLGETYAVATLHRPANVDSPESLGALTAAMSQVADQIDLVLPVHPRGAANLERSGLLAHPRIHPVEPVGYTEFLGLVDRSAFVVTDSGGIQEETTVLGVPCLTLRPNTERPVTITDGTNQLVTPADLPARASAALAAGRPVTWPVPPLWDGHAGERIAGDIATFLA
ncbi:UDP-N-acetylglucosamine 2-epimerase (non-hydrolyzing) [Mumia sp. ZJ1417]|uniref:non-hydrolyzing UDP-N-acetylglucosamine 2-epimerase n=1 Tax=Mumia sp. ZJ1417 TaxID=2708082 RepID=UPI00141E9C03|nr:UDP-N-acetylglucosamine 2-epimerase (non-hydrolyzing) [Mumia sp. ZJ1417]QMW65942.1 UDP-N-acetylglucosamine 2-epimerase (non-hydrolyzing) [Mumia sp. ZJ1417]